MHSQIWIQLHPGTRAGVRAPPCCCSCTQAALSAVPQQQAGDFTFSFPYKHWVRTICSLCSAPAQFIDLSPNSGMLKRIKLLQRSTQCNKPYRKHIVQDHLPRKTQLQMCCLLLWGFAIVLPGLCEGTEGNLTKVIILKLLYSPKSCHKSFAFIKQFTFIHTPAANT